MFENDYVSGDCFSISLDSFVRQPEMDVCFLGQWLCPDSLVNHLLKSEDT